MDCRCPAEQNPFFGSLWEKHLQQLSSMNYHFKVALLKIYWKNFRNKETKRRMTMHLRDSRRLGFGVHHKAYGRGNIVS